MYQYFQKSQKSFLLKTGVYVLFIVIRTSTAIRAHGLGLKISCIVCVLYPQKNKDNINNLFLVVSECSAERNRPIRSFENYSVSDYAKCRSRVRWWQAEVGRVPPALHSGISQSYSFVEVRDQRAFVFACAYSGNPFRRGICGLNHRCI